MALEVTFFIDGNGFGDFYIIKIRAEADFRPPFSCPSSPFHPPQNCHFMDIWMHSMITLHGYHLPPDFTVFGLSSLPPLAGVVPRQRCRPSEGVPAPLRPPMECRRPPLWGLRRC